ncbi:MAG: LysE family translocator [Bauldia sp.]|nr:LysE family translocator [Bauldia sp.]
MSDLLPSSFALAGFAAAVIVLALTPGPDMMLYLSKTITQSRRAGAASLAGALSGLLVHTALAAVGLSALLAASATAFTILKIAGAAYLLWLAWDALRHGSSFSLAPGTAAERLSRLYLKGLLVNLLNPKIIMFFLTFLPQFVAAGDPNAPARLVILGVAFVVIALPISIAQILAAGAIARLLRRSPSVTRGVDFLFAGVMAAFAARLVFSQGK